MENANNGAQSGDARLIVLLCGDDVHVFTAEQEETAATVQMVMDVHYPALDVERLRVTEEQLTEALEKVREQGHKPNVIDVRPDGQEEG